MKQKDFFLKSEGDKWFERNRDKIVNKLIQGQDVVVTQLLDLPPPLERILEIGCSNGYRLEWLNKILNCECKGIEPSAKAVEEARKKGLDVQQGTADSLPYPSNYFDVVIFGFCLYLCDREDLFKIAYEADRVLKNPGWLIIHDFFSKTSCKNEYHHLPGLYSYKMDFKTLFTWHPSYTCFYSRIAHHETAQYTDSYHDWVEISVLRKCLTE